MEVYFTYDNIHVSMLNYTVFCRGVKKDEDQAYSIMQCRTAGSRKIPSAKQVQTQICMTLKISGVCMWVDILMLMIMFSKVNLHINKCAFHVYQ